MFYSCLLIETDHRKIDLISNFIESTADLILHMVSEDLQNTLLDEFFIDIIILSHNLKLDHADILKLRSRCHFLVMLLPSEEKLTLNYIVSGAYYLQEPLSESYFIKETGRMTRTLNQLLASHCLDKNFLLLKDRNQDNRKVRVNFCDVMLIESDKSYVKIQLSNNRVIQSKTPITHIEKIFKHSTNFIKVHRSFIISINHFEQITERGGLKMKDSTRVVPVGRSYKVIVEKRFAKKEPKT